MKYIEGFRDPKAARGITQKIGIVGKRLNEAGRTIRLMEVCGSHTMAIARYGIRDVLPSCISLISGPGCPVCVTDTGYIDAAIELCEKGMLVATFGDMLRVPGSQSNLAVARSAGGDVHVCMSPTDAVKLAQENPNKEVVFLAIGFETTIAPVISILTLAQKLKISNISILTAFKLVPPALEALANDPEVKVEGFLCPAHVSAIIGSNAYQPFVDNYNIPCVIAGFEPLDILYGVLALATQLDANRATLENQYDRVVKPQGNIKAQKLIDKYLIISDAAWRGIGTISASGLQLRPEYENYDATIKHNINIKNVEIDNRCSCGDVLKGKITPSQCPMFSKLCTPQNPIGPCMVSSEGSCAAFYKYIR